MQRAYVAWRWLQERVLQYLSAALLLGLTLLALLEVVRRYVFGVSFPWQQDAVTFGILSGVFLFFAISQSRNAHLRVSAILLLLRSKGGRVGAITVSVIEILSALIGMLFCTWLVWHGAEVFDLMHWQQRKTESLVFLLWPFFITFLIGMGCLGVSCLFQLFHQICVACGKPGLSDPYADEGDDGALL